MAKTSPESMFDKLVLHIKLFVCCCSNMENVHEKLFFLYQTRPRKMSIEKAPAKNSAFSFFILFAQRDKYSTVDIAKSLFYYGRINVVRI